MSIIDELNREFTDILFSSKFFEEDGWNELYSLIKKAKEDCYQIRSAFGSRFSDFTKQERYYLYRAYTHLSVIIIYKTEMVISENTYQRIDYENLCELVDDGIKSLNHVNDKPPKFIRFFRIKGNFIEYKILHHFHIHDTVERAIQFALA